MHEIFFSECKRYFAMKIDFIGNSLFLPSRALNIFRWSWNIMKYFSVDEKDISQLE